MKTKEIIQRLKENGGLNIQSLQRDYASDIKYHNEKGTFKQWLVGYIHYHEGVSYYIAKRVTEYFIGY
jgi:hypothetical protein